MSQPLVIAQSTMTRRQVGRVTRRYSFLGAGCEAKLCVMQVSKPQAWHTKHPGRRHTLGSLSNVVCLFWNSQVRLLETKARPIHRGCLDHSMFDRKDFWIVASPDFVGCWAILTTISFDSFDAG